MIRVAVVTISDSAVAGTREDRSGPAICTRAASLGWEVAETRVVPDDVDAISGALLTLLSLDVIVTTGGTGIAPRDVTPEAIAKVAQREIPGFGELMRSEGLKSTKLAPLSRGGAVTHGT